MNSDQASAGVPARRTRRQLLAGGTGALAAVLAAEALARPDPAAAANGDAVILGHDNTATSQTSITNSAAGVDALIVTAAGGGGSNAIFAVSSSGFAVVGDGHSAGVRGISSRGDGVRGESDFGNGISGQSGATASMFTAGIGVNGITDNASGIGVLGESVAAGGVGVNGTATGSLSFGVAGTSDTGNGVYGQTGATISGFIDGFGVSGITDSASGAGVVGVNAAPGGAGVQGIASLARGIGVTGRATSATGTGVLAANTAGGNALVVSGKAAFSRSGVLTIAAGKSSATQTGVALTPASLVLATLQQDIAGVWVRSAVPNVTGRSFTVHLSESAPRPTRVAWFVVN